MRDLYIVGAGGHGREILDVVHAINCERPTWSFLGFLDDGSPPPEPLRRVHSGVVGPVTQLARVDADYAIGIGNSEDRQRIDDFATSAGRPAATLRHPLSSCGRDVELGPGVVLAAGARVTTNVRIGRHTHVNVNAVVSHDCRLGDYVTVSPGTLVNGSVTLGAHVMLGAGSIVTPGCTIGRRTWVGAGSAVLGDLPADCVAVGVPARVKRGR